MSKLQTGRLFLVAALVFCTQQAWASGFALIEQSSSGLGDAYADGAASASDPTTVFYNPAGMTRLRGRAFTADGILVKPSMRFTNDGSHMAAAFGGAPLTGGEGGDAGSLALVPSVYYTRELDDRFWFGLGINAPFGLSTKYDENWVGRYQAIESSVTSVNINPSLAFKVSDALSVGGGVSAQYLRAVLSQAIDYSAVCLATPSLAANCTAQGVGATTLQSPSTTGLSKNTADDWGYGYNLGLLYGLNSSTRLGMAYRSKVTHTLKGTGDFTIPSAVSSAGAGIGTTLSAVFADTDITSHLTLPETLSLSVYHDIDRKWAIMGDITRTRWSRLPEIRIQFDNPLKSDGVETLNWKDTNRYSVGAMYRYSDSWKLRAGVAYDETPISAAADRTARLPDSNRTWLAVGASYGASAMATVDLGYAHLFMANAPIDHVGVLGDHLTGSYQNYVDILSIQGTWRF